MRRLGPSLRDAWRLAGPYWRSEERGRALLLLAAVVALNLSLVGMDVLLSYWSREFFNSMQERDEAAFFGLLLWGRQTESGPMPGFVFVAAVYIVVAVYALYLQQALQMRWRRWLTREYLDGWLSDRAYYRIALADAGTDNPDQRIAEDLRLFVDETLDLGLGLLRSVVTLLSFILVLWGLSGPADRLRHRHPRLHGLGGAALRRGRHLADAPGRPAPDRPQLRPAAGGGRLPLRPGAPARERRRRGPARRRGGREARPARPLRRAGRQLVGDHGRHQAPDPLHRRLRAGGGGLPLSWSPRRATSAAPSRSAG